MTADIDDALMAQALKTSGLTDQKTVIEESLKLLIRLRRQASIIDLFGKIPLDIDLDASRRD
jgi:Arc/MetJ family transcription regulator